ALNVRAAQNATPTVPIVAISDDMVGEGLTPSLARPSGNTTGVTILAPELDGIRLADRCGAQRMSDGSTCRHTYYDISATSGAPRRDAAARDRANAVCHRQTRGDRKRKQRCKDRRRRSGQRAYLADLICQQTSYHRAHGGIAPTGNVPMAGIGGGANIPSGRAHGWQSLATAPSLASFRSNSPPSSNW